MKLADTSVLIELLRGNKEVEKELKDKEVATCFHVKYELYRGTSLARKTEKGQKEVKCLLEELETLELTQDIAKEASELSEKYSIGTFDLMVAATAIVKDVELITQDSDFQRIDELEVNRI